MPITCAQPRSAARAVVASVASGVENSISTSEAASRAVQVVRGGEADGLEPGKRAQVLAQRRVAGPLQPAGQGDALGFQHLAQIGPAHPSGTAHDPDPHSSPPPRVGRHEPARRPCCQAGEAGAACL